MLFNGSRFISNSSASRFRIYTLGCHIRFSIQIHQYDRMLHGKSTIALEILAEIIIRMATDDSY